MMSLHPDYYLDHRQPGFAKLEAVGAIRYNPETKRVELDAELRGLLKEMEQTA
jgi:hypothetical protein